MLTSTLITIVAPIIFYEEPPVWSVECVAPLQSVLEDGYIDRGLLRVRRAMAVFYDRTVDGEVWQDAGDRHIVRNGEDE